MKIENCCLIGHSLIKHLEVYDRLKNAIEQFIIGGCKHFIVGQHGEFDEYAKSCLLDLKIKYPDIRIEIVMRSPRYMGAPKNSDPELFYPDMLKEPFDYLMYNIEDVYYKARIDFCNKRMIDDCDAVICYIDKTQIHSGAKRAYNYAKRQNKYVYNILQAR